MWACYNFCFFYFIDHRKGNFEDQREEYQAFLEYNIIMEFEGIPQFIIWKPVKWKIYINIRVISVTGGLDLKNIWIIGSLVLVLLISGCTAPPKATAPGDTAGLPVKTAPPSELVIARGGTVT